MFFSVFFVYSVVSVHPVLSVREWLQSDASLFTRVGLGVSIFGVLAWLDLRRNGPGATRWREYLFLLSAVAVALAYGVANDLITVRISPEYFLYGKGLAPAVGNDLRRLPWEAAKVGLKATWTAGLLVGVAILWANNPRAGRRRLSYRRLAARVPMIVGCAVAGAAMFGAAGYGGAFAALSEDFREMVRRDEFRPFRFMAVYGVHLGGYAGGLVGTVAAAVGVCRERGRAREPRLPGNSESLE